MTLKQANMAVLVCLGLSLLWALVSLVFPFEYLRVIYMAKFSQLVFIAKECALLLFFVTLFRNQR